MCKILNARRVGKRPAPDRVDIARPSKWSAQVLSTHSRPIKTTVRTSENHDLVKYVPRVYKKKYNLKRGGKSADRSLQDKCPWLNRSRVECTRNSADRSSHEWGI
jgi:hypothetical protein